jgi:hypothetical protein
MYKLRQTTSQKYVVLVENLYFERGIIHLLSYYSVLSFLIGSLEAPNCQK